MAIITYRFEEWAPDLGPYFSEGEKGIRLRFIQNLLPVNNGYKIADNAFPFGDALTNASSGNNVQTDIAPADRVTLWSHVDTNTGENNFIYVYNDSGTYKISRLYGQPGAAFDAVERASGYANGKFFFTKYGDKIIGTNFEDAIQRKTEGSSVFAKNNDTSGTPTAADPRAKFVEKFGGHLFLGNIDMTSGTDIGGHTYGGAFGPLTATTYPNMIWWSALDNERRFGTLSTTPAILGSDYRIFYDGLGSVTGLKACVDYLAVFRQSGTQIVTVQPFQPITLSENIGLTLATKSIVSVGSDIYFWSTSGPARIVNGESVELLGIRRVNDYLTEIWQGPDDSNITAAVTIDGKYVVWSIPERVHYSEYRTTPGASLTNKYNTLLVYSIYEDRFSTIKEKVGSYTPITSYGTKYSPKSRFAGIAAICNTLPTEGPSTSETSNDFITVSEFEFFGPAESSNFSSYIVGEFDFDGGKNEVDLPKIQTEYTHFPAQETPISFRIQRVRPIIYVEGPRGVGLNENVAATQMNCIRIYSRNRYEGRDLDGNSPNNPTSTYNEFTVQDQDGWFLTDGVPQSNLQSIEFIFNKDYDIRLLYGFEMEIDLQSAYGTSGKELTTI